MNLKINHRLGFVNVDFFNDFALNLKYDSIASTFGFSFYFDPENQQHAEMACVSHFHECILEHEGETLATGYMLSNIFVQNEKKQLVKIGGYSKTGCLEDCDIPTNMYPLQVEGMTLKQIAQKLIQPFKLKLKIENGAYSESNTAITLDAKLDKEIKKTTASESKNIKTYLTELAVQRNVVLSHNEYGDLVFTQAKTNQKPLFHVEKGIIARSIKMNFNGQGMHSQIEVVKHADTDGGNEGYAIIYNPYCPIVFRPKVVVQSSGDDNTIEEYARMCLSQELKNVRLTIEIDRWDFEGKVIKPNNIITVYSPENFIYNTTRFFIESVELKGNEKETTATLTCVLPEVYSQMYPKNIYVDAHRNFPKIKK